MHPDASREISIFDCRSVLIIRAWARWMRHWLRWLRRLMIGEPVIRLNCLLLGDNAPKFFLEVRRMRCFVKEVIGSNCPALAVTPFLGTLRWRYGLVLEDRMYGGRVAIAPEDGTRELKRLYLRTWCLVKCFYCAEIIRCSSSNSLMAAFGGRQN